MMPSSQAILLMTTATRVLLEPSKLSVRTRPDRSRPWLKQVIRCVCDHHVWTVQAFQGSMARNETPKMYKRAEEKELKKEQI